MAMPTLFLTHGAGPLLIRGHPSHASLAAHLKSLADSVPAPKALLIISAHWEESNTTVTSAAQPGLVNDPERTSARKFTVDWPAPGSPELASRVMDLLRSSGFDTKEDSARGFDEGVTVPLKLVFPDAKVPTVVLSLLSSMDPQAHLDMGRALQPLRDEGVLIIGSGSGYHNTTAVMRKGLDTSEAESDIKAEEWGRWLTNVATSSAISPEEREAALARWSDGPHARYAHPREEHLLPLLVAAGAAGCAAGTTIWSDVLMGAQTSSFRFPA